MHSSELTFEIEPRGDAWTISFCHEQNGTFIRRVDAMRSAIGEADRIYRLGHSVRIVVDRPLRMGEKLPRRVLHPHYA
ncbi:hypothetical protein Sa4125_16980 [Aureimonas sp. SA4125]|uniref:hypothetical protein n=1 Tax=Aureimonas sp. SA4125 TaxID=2826993 RepID=UPI001CC7C30E|nr:hypothetical protein [Aureimonas sp. SA4125]BDA84156.1 hypothetical protein Sa4125_16980 [Aureimonas sp. SA4125]